MYGLGSSSRVVGAIALSCPRTKNGSAGRVYSYLKNTIGATEALNYIQKAAFGPYVINNGRLVYK
jgi:hypothetical protein